jgi:hypothetical protein
VDDEEEEPEVDDDLGGLIKKSTINGLRKNNFLNL